MNKVKNKTIIEAVKRAYEFERKYPRGRKYAQGLEDVRNALITALDYELYLDCGRLFNCLFGASILDDEQAADDAVGGPKFMLARYAYGSLVSDIMGRAALANEGKPLHRGAGHDLICRTVAELKNVCDVVEV